MRVGPRVEKHLNSLVCLRRLSNAYFFAMNIIILEGIATSGKTTLTQKLSEYFAAHNISCHTVSEDITLMPILENNDKDVSLELLQKVLAKELNAGVQYLIFDRLHFTHVLKTSSELADFEPVKTLLKQHNCLLVLLTMKEADIGARIAASMEHRQASWREFVIKKGTMRQIAEYYTNQQRQLIELGRQSQLRTVSYDVTDKQYDDIAQKVLDEFD